MLSDKFFEVKFLFFGQQAGCKGNRNGNWLLFKLIYELDIFKLFFPLSASLFISQGHIQFSGYSQYISVILILIQHFGLLAKTSADCVNKTEGPPGLRYNKGFQHLLKCFQNRQKCFGHAVCSSVKDKSPFSMFLIKILFLIKKLNNNCCIASSYGYFCYSVQERVCHGWLSDSV